MKINNPIKLILLSIIVAVFFLLLIIIIAGVSTSGGQQLPLTILAYGIKALPVIGIAISGISIIIYKDWSKKYWYWLGLLISLLSLSLFYLSINQL